MMVELTVQVHCVGFTADLDCFQCSSLPDAPCCSLDLCSLSINVMAGGMSYSVPRVIISYSLFVFVHSNLQSSLSLSNVYLAAVVTGDLVYRLLLLFWGLLFHSYKQLLQGVLALENGFHPMGCTGLL